MNFFGDCFGTLKYALEFYAWKNVFHTLQARSFWEAAGLKTLKGKADMKAKLERIFGSNAFFYTLAAITFCLITVAAVVFGQSPIRLAPFYLSIVVRILHSKANRYGHLIGGLNQILYGFVYMYYKLYASMLYAFIFSGPLQVITFLSWSKRKYRGSTVFRKLSLKLRLLLSLGAITAYVIYVSVASKTDASHVFIDCAISVIGITSSCLTLFVCREYIYLSLLNNVLQVLLYSVMSAEAPETVTYLIFGIYALICAVRQFFSVRRLCREQDAQKDACASALAEKSKKTTS